METEAVLTTLAVDFSVANLFLEAGLVVKLVMLLLLFASFWSWAIIIQKFISFRRVRVAADRFERRFWSGEPLEELHERLGDHPSGGFEQIFCAAMDERSRSRRRDGGLQPGVGSRIDRSMGIAVARETSRLSSGLGFLATVGATAPFVGLFGTVWGIMNVFREIGVQENTNLAVVAPGIGEALAATALGLLAAIPAVVFYNHLSAASDRLAARFEDFADEFSTIISRQLDQ